MMKKNYTHLSISTCATRSVQPWPRRANSKGCGQLVVNNVYYGKRHGWPQLR